MMTRKRTRSRLVALWWRFRLAHRHYRLFRSRRAVGRIQAARVAWALSGAGGAFWSAKR